MNIEDFPGWPELRAIIDETRVELDRTCWIAGGALLRAATGEAQTGDLDVWSNGLEAHRRAEASLKGAAAFHVPREYSDLFILHSGARVELIDRIESSPEACILNFDLSICQLAWDSERLHVGTTTMDDIASKLLRVVNGRSPLRAQKRFDRYILRGYRVTIDTVLSALAAPQDPYNDYEDENDPDQKSARLLREFRDSVRYIRTREQEEALAARAEALLGIAKDTGPADP